MKNQHLIDGLSISDKVELLQHLYADIAGHGTDGDTELAHVNRFEAQVLRNIGGSGTVNQVTGLRQFGKGGGGSAPPQPTQQVIQKTTPEYAPEQKEYIRDIFEQSKQLYEQRGAEGFQPFPGPQLAPFAPQEQAAFTGIEQLARGPGPAEEFSLARQAALGAAAPIGQADISRLMSPYQQAVTDIAQREAVRQYQMGPAQQLRTQAVAEGGLRGARRAVQEAEGERNLGQRLTDIQTMGLQSAYDKALAQAAAERGRLAGLAQQLPALGTGAYQQQLAQLGQLGGVGEAQRGMEQQAINLAQEQFQRELMFPEETLATYLRFISGAPQPVGSYQTSQTLSAPPSRLSQLASLGIGGASLGKAFGAFSSGGSVGKHAGLSGIVRRNKGGQIVRMQSGQSVFDAIVQSRMRPQMDDPLMGIPEGDKIPVPMTYPNPWDIGERVFAGTDAGEFISNLRRQGKRFKEDWLYGPGRSVGLGIADFFSTKSPEQKYAEEQQRREEQIAEEQKRQAEDITYERRKKSAEIGLSPEAYLADVESSGYDPLGLYSADVSLVRKIEEPAATKTDMSTATPELKSTPPERPAAKPEQKPQTAKEEAKGLLDRLESEDYLAIAAAALGGIGKPTTGSALGDIGQAISPVAAAAAESLREGRKARREQAAETRAEKQLELLQAAEARAAKLAPYEEAKLRDYALLLRAQAEETSDPTARQAKLAAGIKAMIEAGMRPEDALAALGMSVPSKVSNAKSHAASPPGNYR